MKEYTPPQAILEKYAKVLVHAGLGDGAGVKPGQVISIRAEDAARPLVIELYKEVIRAGCHPLMRYVPSGIDRAFYDLASDKHLDFFPEKFARGLIDQIDHSIAIIAETDPEELKGVDPARIMRASRSGKKMREWLDTKENAGKFHWTLGLYGTSAMAKEAGLSQKEYWNQIIKACFLDEKDPVAKTKSVQAEIRRVSMKLNALNIESVRMVAPGTDIVFGFHPLHKWIGGTGRNIPSFEIFTTPDMRRTEGVITTTEPLYRYGNKATGIKLTFKAGKVVKIEAKTGRDWLAKMIAEEGASMVGEYSLTDSRVSRITKFMADTLFDENVGGKNGNSHFALGKSYQDCYRGNPAKVSKAEWKKMGWNESPVHTDIVSTSNRTVTATLRNSKQVVIYKDGKFTV